MPKREYFPKVKEAREALREQALDLYERHLALIDQAAKEGKLEAALTASQWLIEHMPKGDDGETIIDASAAKIKEVQSGPVGPQIQIGIALSGVPQPKALPQVIDVTSKDENP